MNSSRGSGVASAKRCRLFLARCGAECRLSLLIAVFGFAALQAIRSSLTDCHAGLAKGGRTVLVVEGAQAAGRRNASSLLPVNRTQRLLRQWIIRATHLPGIDRLVARRIVGRIAK